MEKARRKGRQARREVSRLEASPFFVNAAAAAVGGALRKSALKKKTTSTATFCLFVVVVVVVVLVSMAPCRSAPSQTGLHTPGWACWASPTVTPSKVQVGEGPLPRPRRGPFPRRKDYDCVKVRVCEGAAATGCDPELRQPPPPHSSPSPSSSPD